jgi:hypothetical protein
MKKPFSLISVSILLVLLLLINGCTKKDEQKTEVKKTGYD